LKRITEKLQINLIKAEEVKTIPQENHSACGNYK